jgi:PAS domain S-box-containing protein
VAPRSERRLKAMRKPPKRRARRAGAAGEAFTRIFQASPVAIALASWEDGNLLEVNDAWVEMVGIPRSEAVGRNASELDLASPELRAEVRTRLERGERIYGIPHEFRTRSGELRHDLLSMARIEVAGRPCLLAFALDMTDRRRVTDDLVASETRYWLLVERNPLPMWVYDRETLRILGVNEATVRHLGYSRDELRKMTVLDLRPPEERPRLEKEVEDIEGYRFSGVWKLRRKDGAIVDVEILSHDMPFAERPARVVLANDITERLRGEERLRRSYEELRALSARLERIREEESRRIARAVHDEVGQALTAIKIDLVEAERALAEAGGAPDAALKRLAEIGRLLDDTLDVVHRISTELRPGVLDELGLEAAVEWQLEEFRKRTGVACRFASELGSAAVDGGRSTAVFRVLQELLTNVARHAHAREVVARLAVEGGALVLDLADDGCGIPARAVTAPQSFGLAGIRERVAQFGGEVEIRGVEGRGTFVKVVIPL